MRGCRSTEHCNMIRGKVPKERLLEWYVEDGWEPLCKFLGKEIPKVPFPRANDAAAFEKTKDKLIGLWSGKALRNMAVCSAMLVVGIAAVVWRLLC